MKEISCISMLAALLLLFTQCKGSKTSIPVESSEEKVESKVHLECDFNASIEIGDREECGLLLVLPNGLILQPSTRLDIESDLTSGSKVRVSYKVIEDMSTTCDKAVAMADISCLIKIDPGNIEDCADVRDPFDVAWMKSAVNTLDARKVTRFSYLEERAYMFSGTKETVIYDCYGQELCRYGSESQEDCMSVVSKLSNEYVILVVNE